MTQLSEDWTLGNIRCHSQFENVTLPGYCQSIWDGYLCWPPTPAGTTAKLQCPPTDRGIGGVKRFASRTCGGDGVWTGRMEGETPSGNYSLGRTNLAQCLNFKDEQMGEGTRGFELIGLTISMISLILAIFTFCHFRNLWSNRTRIHKNLFISLCIQVLLRIIVTLDQIVSSPPSSVQISPRNSSRNNSGYVCESFYLLFEYAKTSMFLWIFVDGLHLHNVMTVAIASDRLSQTCYYCLGWGAPIFLTIFWALIAAKEFQLAACSWANNTTPYSSVLETPRLIFIVLNLLLLANVVRLLATRMRDTSSPEILQVRKALRSSLLLLPLLGTTNYLRMIYTPEDKSTAQFVTWSYFQAFLTSFQGFFCALICCFLNGEVQLSIKLSLREWRRRDDPNSSDAFDLAASLHQRLQEKRGCGGGSDGGNGNDQKSDDTIGGDPFKENWSEVELSSHNNVDIEHIEIPTEYIIKQSHGSSVCNKLSHSSVSSSGLVVGEPERRQTPATNDVEAQNHVIFK